MELLSVAGLRKAYGGAVALRGASLTLHAGEILALMGENGAGKSTLIKILAGAVAADGGEIRIGGSPAAPHTPRDSHRLGLRFIHQELNVIRGLSVAENIFLGHAYPRRFGLVDWRTLHARAHAALAALGVEHISLRTPVGRLPVGDRMLVKIAAAFLREDGEAPRIFVLDEPTAALAHIEAERLFRMIATLRAQGCGVLYVSHRLDEVLALADRIAVLRDGETAATVAAKETSKAQLISLMTGRRPAEAGAAPDVPQEEVALAVEGLSTDDLHDIGFDLRRGEILGVAGLAGSGAERITRALISGAGRLTLAGEKVRLRGPADAWARGVALLPRERRAEGLLLGEDITHNVALPHLSRLSRWGWLIDRRRQRERAVATGRRVRLKATGPDQKVRALSGGNQQKVMFARAIEGAPRALLLDEPTRGVDVGAKYDIHALLRELADAGAGVLVASSDQEELLQICSRILILRQGRLAAVVASAGLTPQALLALCYGESLA